MDGLEDELTCLLHHPASPSGSLLERPGVTWSPHSRRCRNKCPIYHHPRAAHPPSSPWSGEQGCCGWTSCEGEGQARVEGGRGDVLASLL